MKPPAFLRPITQFPRKLLLGLGVAMGLLAALGAYAGFNLRQQAEAADWVTHTYQVVAGLQGIFSSVQDAESSQRAFLVSGNETYLGPCDRAMRMTAGTIQRGACD